MHGLTLLKQDKVGDIDNSIDRAHTGTSQLFLHPQRAWLADINIANDSTHVARTSFTGLQLNL